MPTWMLPVLLLVNAGLCMVQSYAVEPVKADWSGWTSIEDNQVSQILTVD